MPRSGYVIRMPANDTPIQHVSDTAIWVAYYRALESARPDALFNDPLAKVLVGDRGQKIAERMEGISQFTRWTVVLRTRIIDTLLGELVRGGVEMVINLGAGLDTRPYRLDLPGTLKWVEIDFPHVIEHKTQALAAHTPKMQLERIAMDLGDRARLHSVLAKIAAGAQRVVVLTEGVIPYLSEKQVAHLAEDLRGEKKIHYWVAEYLSPHTYAYFKTRKRVRQMKNAPFLFFPPDWFEFFRRQGWQAQTIRYFGDEARAARRPAPLPWWFVLLRPFLPKKRMQEFDRSTAYVVFVPVQPL